MTVTTIPKHFNTSDCVKDDFLTLSDRVNRMKDEGHRLATYSNWPSYHAQSPHLLAEAGLYYTGSGDRVQCAFCQGVLKNWRPQDTPMSEHERHFPFCRFIRGYDVGNVPYRHNPQIVNFHFHYPVLHPRPSEEVVDFTKETVRLGTFVSWPQNLTQTPNELARAGFYHVPTRDRPDRVKCAYCQGKIYNWGKADDPWMEHAKCFPTCKYAKLCVGENVLRDFPIQDLLIHEAKATREVTSPDQTAVTSFMEGSAAQHALQMGFTSESVRRIVQLYYCNGHLQFLSAQKLATELLEGADDENSIGVTVPDLICDSDWL